MSDEDGAVSAAHELIDCPACQRRMRREVFAKHPKVCQKNPANQRNVSVFDMTRYRAIKAGDQLIPVCKVLPSNTNKTSDIHVRPSQTRSTKRDRHSNTLVPPIIDNFCCPTCKRTFCEKAYDRHVAFCTRKVKQIQQPPSDDVLLARFKLDRRTKFGYNRAPPTFSKTAPLLPTPIINQDRSPAKLPTAPLGQLPLERELLTVLAYCPWCSKPYIPNCVHYCRKSKERFSLHS